MTVPTIPELYLAFRQAKSALYYERRGVGLLELAAYEEKLPENLATLQSKLARKSWFDGIELGPVWVVPKRLRAPKKQDDKVKHIGGRPASPEGRHLDVQLRLSPSPEFAIVELLYLRRFGPALDSLLSKESLGYRLDVKSGILDPHRRWVFEYWPTRYQQFRTAPLTAARAELENGSESVLIVSADLASFYDTIDPSFMLHDDFVALVHQTEAGAGLHSEEYIDATASLLGAFQRFRDAATKSAGIPMKTGIPIGALTSRVVANVALETLDTHISTNPDVISYRRYVDDLVIVTKGSQPTGFDEVLQRVLPLTSTSDEAFMLDVEGLHRNGCEFQLQKTKVGVHHLTGVPGQDFIDAVSADFARIVSESRAFIDTASIAHDGASHLVRAGQNEGSPLRVFRDADRARLEKFSLSTSLRSLERISAMVDRDQARLEVRRTLERVSRVLDTDDDWVSNLDTALRLLKLAISTEDWETYSELIKHMDSVWGTVESLMDAIPQLYYRNTRIAPSPIKPWRTLRNYLHVRRLEAVCSTLPVDFTLPNLKKWFPNGLRVETVDLGGVALRNRANSLAASDLRALDREDDHNHRQANGKLDLNWLDDELSEDVDLSERLRLIRTFVELCRKVGDRPWQTPPARLFLCTRPPSYFDIARRWLYRTEVDGFTEGVFLDLLDVVNAVRGTSYSDPVGQAVGEHTVAIPVPDLDAPQQPDPRVILGNLVVGNDDWAGAATRVPGSPAGKPRLDLKRFLGLSRVLEKASRAAGTSGFRQGVSSAVLVLPELSLPRQWFRTVARHVVQLGRFGLVVGLEYWHSPKQPFVTNQTFAVLPGPFSSVAAWPWTKRLPAREEQQELAKLKTPLSYEPAPSNRPPRTSVLSPWGRFSVLVCSELIEARRVADLLGRVDLLLCPAWNRDAPSYDHLIQSAGLQLHAIVAVANNGYYSDCRAWAPFTERWRRDLCRLIERKMDDVVHFDAPLRSLEAFHAMDRPLPQEVKCPPGCEPRKPRWKPLPPDWPQPVTAGIQLSDADS